MIRQRWGCMAPFVLLLSMVMLQCKVEQAEPEITTQPEPFMLGIDVLERDNFKALEGKKVGLVTHPPSTNKDMIWDVDIFLNQSVFELVALYGPEHGLFGQAHAGDKVDSNEYQGVKVHSLYGATRKPTPEMLKGLDVIVFDLQDIGVRSYTYISTLALVMESCAEQNLPIMILDRPNPIGGNVVDGPVLESEFRSFVGYLEVPYVHGMTMGEIGQWINTNLLENKVQLEIIEMQGWTRNMSWPDTGLTWIPTSPHIPRWDSALFCAMTGMIGDLSWVSTGVGYTQPFELIGAPWMDGQKLARALNANNPSPGLSFRATSFRPFYAIFQGEDCQGVQIHLHRIQDVKPIQTTMAIMAIVQAEFPEFDPSKNYDEKKLARLDKLWGSRDIMSHFRAQKDTPSLVALWADEVQDFLNSRQPFLLY